MSKSYLKRSKQWQPSFGKHGALYPSQGMKAITRRELARTRATHTPTRHDFRTPTQKLIGALKSSARTFVFPTIA